MTNRKKPETILIKSLDDANKRLTQIAALQRDLQGIEDNLNKNIDRAKTLAAEQSHPFRSQLKTLEDSLVLYAEYNKSDLFKSKKTVEVLSGEFGYRKSTRITPKRGKKVVDIIETIKTMNLTNGLTIVHKLDREAMHSWTDEQLATVGAQRKETETFWYEVKKEIIDENP